MTLAVRNKNNLEIVSNQRGLLIIESREFGQSGITRICINVEDAEYVCAAIMQEASDFRTQKAINKANYAVFQILERYVGKAS